MEIFRRPLFNFNPVPPALLFAKISTFSSHFHPFITVSLFRHSFTTQHYILIMELVSLLASAALASANIFHIISPRSVANTSTTNPYMALQTCLATCTVRDVNCESACVGASHLSRSQAIPASQTIGPVPGGMTPASVAATATGKKNYLWSDISDDVGVWN